MKSGQTIADKIGPTIKALAREAAERADHEVASVDDPTFQLGHGGSVRGRVKVRVHLKGGGFSDHVFDYDSATGENITEAIGP